MNVRLTYQSGQQYSERLTDFKVKVSRTTTRLKVSFREKDSGADHWGYASLSLPFDKAQQLAYAMLTACAGDAQPVEFGVEEAPINKAAAA